MLDMYTLKIKIALKIFSVQHSVIHTHTKSFSSLPGVRSLLTGLRFLSHTGLRDKEERGHMIREEVKQAACRAYNKLTRQQCHHVKMEMGR